MSEENLIYKNCSVWSSPPFDHNTISKVNDLKKNNLNSYLKSVNNQ